jgi:hypothetical protein
MSDPIKKFNRNKQNRDKLAPEKRAFLDARANETVIERKNRLSASRKEAQIKNVYGLTLTEYETLWQEQNGCCAICGESMLTYGLTSTSANVDHDHDLTITDKRLSVRGLLHKNCNLSLSAVDRGSRVPTLGEVHYLLLHLARLTVGMQDQSPGVEPDKDIAA